MRTYIGYYDFGYEFARQEKKTPSFIILLRIPLISIGKPSPLGVY